MNWKARGGLFQDMPGRNRLPGALDFYSREKLGRVHRLEHANNRSAVSAAVWGGSLKGNKRRAAGRRCGQKDMGHNKCESNVATLLQASHPTQELISD